MSIKSTPYKSQKLGRALGLIIKCDVQFLEHPILKWCEVHRKKMTGRKDIIAFTPENPSP